MLKWIRNHPLLAYFIMTYAISWIVWFPVVATARGWTDWKSPYALYYAGSFGPLIAALIVTALTEGRAGLRNLFARFVRWRVQFRYYLFALGAPAALFLLAILVHRVVADNWPELALLGQPDYLPYLSPLGTLGLWLVTYGLGEEAGWRGFALPNLQKTRTAGSATLVLAALWAGWHLPAFLFRDTYQTLGLLGFPFFAFMMIFTTMVFTWLYNSTRGSVFIVILFHAVFDWFSVSGAGGQYSAIVMSAPIVGWALFVARRYGQENAAPVVRQTALGKG